MERDLLHAVERALRDAFECLSSLPPGRFDRPGRHVTLPWDLVGPVQGGEAPGRTRRPAPSPARIDAMDRAFAWLLVLPAEQRRLVAAYARGVGYRRLGTMLGVSHQTARTRHRAALADIADRLLRDQLPGGMNWR